MSAWRWVYLPWGGLACVPIPRGCEDDDLIITWASRSRGADTTEEGQPEGTVPT